jgi:GrpB-like predicted nucleotidyltransferase (UPF0157 family)
VTGPPEPRRPVEERLADHGIRRRADPFDAWCRLRAVEERRTTVIDLYELVARPRGLEPYELPLPERIQLARRALAVIWPGFETTTGSERETEPIELVPYDDGWPTCFVSWRDRLRAVLGASRIEHVGSTAVPGLPAKPVIDIQVSVRDIDDEDGYVPALESAGVQLRSRDAQHRYFRPFAGRPRDVHVHVCATESEWEREHLLFRDYLRAHADAVAAYAAAKQRAATLWWDDRITYTEAKSDVILDVLRAAEDWARSTSWSVDRQP